MKTAKILLAVFVASSLSIASAPAQGRINFSNSSVAPLYVGTPWNGPSGNFTVLGTASTATFGIGPASVRIQLFAGLTSTSLSPVLIGTGANQNYVTNTASTIASAQGTFNGGSSLPLSGFDGSTPVFLQMYFSSIDGLYYGRSSIIQVVPSLSPFQPTAVFGPPGTPNAWNSADPWNYDDSLTIGIAVPEPSALALVSSSCFMMFVRRRK